MIFLILPFSNFSTYATKKLLPRKKNQYNPTNIFQPSKKNFIFKKKKVRVGKKKNSTAPYLRRLKSKIFAVRSKDAPGVLLQFFISRIFF